MTKIIKVPKDIQLQDKLTGKTGDTVSFAMFVRKTLLPSRRFADGYESLKCAAEIDRKLGECFAGGDLPLELSTWEKLRDEAKKPIEGTYAGSPLVMIQCFPFIEAIIGASDA